MARHFSPRSAGVQPDLRRRRPPARSRECSIGLSQNPTASAFFVAKASGSSRAPAIAPEAQGDEDDDPINTAKRTVLAACVAAFCTAASPEVFADGAAAAADTTVRLERRRRQWSPTATTAARKPARHAERRRPTATSSISPSSRCSTISLTTGALRDRRERHRAWSDPAATISRSMRGEPGLLRRSTISAAARCTDRHDDHGGSKYRSEHTRAAAAASHGRKSRPENVTVDGCYGAANARGARSAAASSPAA